MSELCCTPSGPTERQSEKRATEVCSKGRLWYATWKAGYTDMNYGPTHYPTWRPVVAHPNGAQP